MDTMTKNMDFRSVFATNNCLGETMVICYYLTCLHCSWEDSAYKSHHTVFTYEIIKEVMVCVVIWYIIAKDLVICHSLKFF
jgi:hypothetical protein